MSNKCPKCGATSRISTLAYFEGEDRNEISCGACGFVIRKFGEPTMPDQPNFDAARKQYRVEEREDGNLLKWLVVNKNGDELERWEIWIPQGGWAEAKRQANNVAALLNQCDAERLAIEAENSLWRDWCTRLGKCGDVFVAKESWEASQTMRQDAIDILAENDALKAENAKLRALLERAYFYCTDDADSSPADDLAAEIRAALENKNAN